MKHTLDTYRRYNDFCQTVALEAKTRAATAGAAGALAKALAVIAALVVHPAVFSAILLLAGGGALLYYGSIGALIAANPWLAGILVVVTAATGGGVGLIYKQREVLRTFQRTVVDRYEGDYLAAPPLASPSDLSIPPERETRIDGLIDRAVTDFLNALLPLGRLTPAQLSTALAGIGGRRG